MYHLIIGDSAFVKHSLASIDPNATSPFVIVYLKHHEILLLNDYSKGVKIAAIHGISLGTRDIPNLFAFFLTGEQSLLDVAGDTGVMHGMRSVDAYDDTDDRPSHGETVIRNAPETARSSTTSDLQRISHTIREMFGKLQPGDTATDKDNREIPDFHEDGIIGKRDRVRSMRSGVHRIRLRWWHSFAFVLCVFIMPLLWYGVSMGIFMLVQWRGMSALQTLDTNKIHTIVSISTYWKEQANASLSFVGVPIRLIGGSGIVHTQERLVSIAGDVLTAQRAIVQLVSDGQRLSPFLLGTQINGDNAPASIPASIDRLRFATDTLATSLGLVVAQVRLIRDEGVFPFSIPRIQEILQKAERMLSTGLSRVTNLGTMISLYRAAGGFDGKKTYLILLQNSMELRPTGGFIGSVATVSVEDGIMTMPSVQDVYALDGQLKGHVDPPIPIKELLEQEHWYLRDSNWDPDFRISAEKAAWFYEKESGVTVDGVIAVSSELLTDLLGATGPLSLPDYNDRITKENFFGKSLFYTKADFFPGSTQKKDFLGSLLIALLGSVTSRSTGNNGALVQVLEQALNRADIQFWFSGGNEQSIAEQAGWTGALVPKTSCDANDTGCKANTIAFVESNMGINKANFYISRSIRDRVDVDTDGRIRGTVTITYTNTSGDDSILSGGGVYLGYMRLYMPADAVITSASYDGREIGGKSAKRLGRVLPYREEGESRDRSVGTAFAISVAPGMVRRLMITYQRGEEVRIGNTGGTLIHALRKQPGMVNTALETIIGYPFHWTAHAKGPLQMSVVDGFLANAKELRYNTDLDQTKTFILIFGNTVP